jgi:hypothetical protein
MVGFVPPGQSVSIAAPGKRQPIHRSRTTTRREQSFDHGVVDGGAPRRRRGSCGLERPRMRVGHRSDRSWMAPWEWPP